MVLHQFLVLPHAVVSFLCQNVGPVPLSVITISDENGAVVVFFGLRTDQKAVFVEGTDFSAEGQPIARSSIGIAIGGDDDLVFVVFIGFFGSGSYKPFFCIQSPQLIIRIGDAVFQNHRVVSMVVVIISGKVHEKAVFINIAVLVRTGSPVAIISVILLNDMII